MQIRKIHYGTVSGSLHVPYDGASGKYSVTGGAYTPNDLHQQDIICEEKAI